MSDASDQNALSGVRITGDHNIVGDYNTFIYQGTPVCIPSLQAVAAHRAALHQWLEHRARSRWGEMSNYVQQEGATLPLEASPYEQDRLGVRENLLSTLRNADRLLVLGEPGAGKTVALERLAWELCNGPEPLVPVLIPLFNYAGTPLAEWVRAKLKDRGYLRLDNTDALEVFLETPPARCFFLFDGLNEVIPSYRDTLIDELIRWMGAYPRHAMICTSRPQDEIWRRLRGEMRTVMVRLIGYKQAELYLMAHLGEERGKSLYARLDERLKAMARRPLVLWLIKEAGKVEDSIPGNRGELYGRFVSRILRRDTERRMDAEIPESMKHQALAELAYTLGLEQRLFCSREEAVSIVAMHMDPEQSRSVIDACLRHGLLIGEETISFAPHQTMQEYFAAEALLDRWKREQSERMLKHAFRMGASLLGIHSGVLQLAAQDWWMETFVQLAGLADDTEDLAAALMRVNPWLAWWCAEEGHGIVPATREAIAMRSVKLLESESAADRRRAVGMLSRVQNDRAIAPLFKAAGDVDAEVAGVALQALDEMGKVVRPHVVMALRGTDCHQWKSALRYLIRHPDDSYEHVVRTLFHLVADTDAEISEMALQVLKGMEKLVRPLVEAALHGTDNSQLKSAIRYLNMNPHDTLWKLVIQYLLMHLDDPLCGEVPTSIWEEIIGVEMIYISPGPFWMGSDKVEDPLADDNEVPKHQVTLHGYWIGKTPVTVAQFRVFVESGGYRVEEKSLEGHDDYPVVYVSLKHARAYCDWLSERSGLTVALPSEAEWEKAARGTDGRMYPWGNAKPDIYWCNFDNHEEGLTSVGHYSPQGDSPHGCVDMAGNVWEWTRSLCKAYPYDPADGREDLDADGGRVLRGGSFDSNEGKVRCTARFENYPGYRDYDIGFRIVLSPYF